MEPIDEIIITTNPNDHYDLGFIEESDCGDDGKWVKHISETHKEQMARVKVSDTISPPSPATRELLRQYQHVIVLSKVDVYLRDLEISSTSDNNDSSDDDDDDGSIHCTIDGVEQSPEPR